MGTMLRTITPPVKLGKSIEETLPAQNLRGEWCVFCHGAHERLQGESNGMFADFEQHNGPKIFT